jgi:hypothetical protein
MILQEGSHSKALRFEFVKQWRVCKYDDHSSFYHKVQQCQGMKAVDILATDGHEILWIEVKNFRGDSAKNSPRLQRQNRLKLKNAVIYATLKSKSLVKSLF